MTTNLEPPTGRRRAAARIAGWTAVAAIGALAITGVALAAPAITGATNSAATPAPSASGSADPDKPHGRAEKGKRHGPLARLGRAVHAEAVVKDKDGKFVTVFTQRGEVTAISATSITLKSADGFTATYAVNAETKIMKDRKAAKIADIKVQDMAGVIATKSGEVKTAKGIAVGRGPKTDD